MARFVKGSQEAKDYMASIRKMKNGGEEMPKKEKKVMPKRSRTMKGSEEAKAMMKKVRDAKK
jgi:hypothetical protein